MYGSINLWNFGSKVIDIDPSQPNLYISYIFSWPSVISDLNLKW